MKSHSPRLHKDRIKELFDDSNLVNEIKLKKLKEYEALELRKRRESYSSVVKDLHQPKTSKRLQLELAVIK